MSLDLQDIFLWICKNHPGKTPIKFISSFKRLQKNLSTFDLIYDEIEDDFTEYVMNNTNHVLSININDEYSNAIGKFYKFYFYSGTDFETEGPMTLNEALQHDNIFRSWGVDDVLTVEYNKNVLSWDEVQIILTISKPIKDSKIWVNGQQYTQLKKGEWFLNEQIK